MAHEFERGEARDAAFAMTEWDRAAAYIESRETVGLCGYDDARDALLDRGNW